MRRTIFEPEHDAFRETVRRFVAEEVTPNLDAWEAAGIVPRELYAKAAAKGIIGTAVPERHGGLGLDDFRFNQIVVEELAYAGAGGSGHGLTLHNDICLPYFLRYCTPEQAERWLPGIADGTLITAVAMTEPHSGSDLASMTTSARRDGDGYVVNGAKTFITSAINADLVITAVKTDPRQRHRGISLVVVERGAPGFERGRMLEKIGQHAQDTAELFFSDTPVPAADLLGEEGAGFSYLVSNLAQERLSIALSGVASAQAALDWTLEFARERTAFGRPIGTFQANRFALAEMKTEIELATQYCDQAVLALNAGELSGEDAAMAKWWCTELQGRVLDRCVQLHGGYGYMSEYPIARAWADARITRIYAGTTEIMKEIVGRSLGV
ncbi:acyl-CoA dehydrogenase family protein [Conexibacter stalactiti]|uniref:Acyl-[acyl-carrier-protein] dehydrogenase MbtN n=1 Tax=Conexibacter stalactiti TaxID=1940611 RepID=A0ABU4HR66_9ACTN|nr:acyl-CoA dehydrogenase family protein [Conexibacter stalactiti]MDW5595801.1 acyl-CoA dehydrogenase family protein [Conexibacter stalactiti]MEC5036443.1 acyl-CoA dehydrogenase family protein [Conexibacter stalactiti]